MYIKYVICILSEISEQTLELFLTRDDTKSMF